MEKKPSSDEYIYMQDNTRIEKVIYGRDKETGADKEGIKFDIIPIKKIEQSYIQNCDTLAGIFDGTITKSECFFDGKSRHNKPIEHAIYLDKSARPVHFLLRKIWSQLSDMKIPKASYRNIDKHQWRKLMKKGTVNVEAPEVDAISLDNITDPEEKIELVEHIARIRATYLSHEDLEKIDESNFVEEVWNFPTILDGKTVAIVDEVKSSGATLKIADILMQKAIPEANFEPVYWSVPGLTRWTAYDKDGNSSSEYAASKVPVWYDRDIEGGRMIRDRLPLESQKSESKNSELVLLYYLGLLTQSIRKTVNL